MSTVIACIDTSATRSRVLITLALLLTILAGAGSALADWLDDIGYTSLSQRVDLADGAGMSMLQVESVVGTNAYLPDPGRSTFVGKTFTDITGVGQTSWHANLIGDMVYGVGTSMLPGLADVSVQESSDFLDNSVFYLSGTADPVSLAGYDIVTHSWINRSVNNTALTRAVLKFDQQLAEGNVLGVTGIDNIENNSGTWVGFSLPTAMGATHNGLSVGSSDGWTSDGPTYDSRMKPDLVAPGVNSATGSIGKSSWSLARVASGVGLLRAEALAHGWTNGDDARVIQAAAMAGAIKLGERYNVVIDSSGTLGTIPAWAKGFPEYSIDDELRPLDFYQGAGQFNVEHSWDILSFGEQGPGAGNVVLPAGYDLATVDAATSNTYYFDVFQDAQSFSAVLDWFAQISRTGQTWDAEVTDLSLVLYEVDVDGQSLGAQIQASRSNVDNVEHIWIENLLAGRYALVVEGGASLDEYGLAWQTLGGMIAGDANNDGWVDEQDLVLWQQGYDPLGDAAYHTWLDGDWNADGLVDGADLALWQQNYNAADGGEPPVVPEPATMLLLSAGAGALLRRRRH